MIRSYDLAMEEETVETMLNDPHLRLTKLRVGCSESGYTTATLSLQVVEEPIERKRRRRVRRFVLFNGLNHELDQLVDDSNTKIIKQHEFITEQGVIIVLDYELKREDVME